MHPYELSQAFQIRTDSMPISSMDQARIMTQKTKAFVDSSKTEKSYHSSVLLLGNYVQGLTLFTEGPKVEFRGKAGTYMAFSPLTKCKEPRYLFCLISKILPGQNIKGFPTPLF